MRCTSGRGDRGPNPKIVSAKLALSTGKNNQPSGGARCSLKATGLLHDREAAKKAIEN